MGSSSAHRIAVHALACAALMLGAPTTNAADTDPPDRVARLSYLQGQVSLQPAGVEEWAAASLNRPLTTDDELWLAADARAELQVGSINIHLDQNTSFSFLELSDNVTQARLAGGALHVNVRRLLDGEIVEVDTPHGAINLTRPGDYHIEVAGDEARTLVKTYSGECEIGGIAQPIRLGPREQVSIGADGALLARESLTQRNDFDVWANARNDRAAKSVASRYVAPDVIGYEDLDDHGHWVREVDYGHVWYPTHVAVGWSPYRYGHWTYIGPWGWTWIDDAPWGFAPFHYGRWAHVHGRWGWVPGPVHIRPVYAPALVAWVGGPHFSFSVSYGHNVGWYPLAPYDVYVPGYHCSRRYIHNVNYSNSVGINVTTINRVYVNRQTHIDYRHRNLRDAYTVTSRDAFVGAKPIRNQQVRVGGNLNDWRTHNVTPDIKPERVSSLGAHGARAFTKPAWVDHQQRQVITQRTPTRVNRAVESQGFEKPLITRGNPRGVTSASQAARTPVAAERIRNPREVDNTDRPVRVFDRTFEERPTGDMGATQRSRQKPIAADSPEAFGRPNSEKPRVWRREPIQEMPQREAPQREMPRAEPPRAREIAEPRARQYEAPARNEAPSYEAPPARSAPPQESSSRHDGARHHGGQRRGAD